MTSDTTSQDMDESFYGDESFDMDELDQEGSKARRLLNRNRRRRFILNDTLLVLLVQPCRENGRKHTHCRKAEQPILSATRVNYIKECQSARLLQRPTIEPSKTLFRRHPLTRGILQCQPLRRRSHHPHRKTS